MIFVDKESKFFLQIGDLTVHRIREDEQTAEGTIMHISVNKTRVAKHIDLKRDIDGKDYIFDQIG